MTQPYIVCPRCGLVSHNPNDVRERYCGHCHRFHDDDAAEEQLRTAMFEAAAAQEPLRDNPLDQNGECIYCDEPALALHDHDETCRWRLEHRHHYILQREEIAPTGPPPEHTKFYVMHCGCGAVSIFPRDNWQLVTEAWKTEFLAHLYAVGFYLEL